MAMSDKPLRSDFRSIFVFHAVFVRMLNDLSDWTDQFDSGCKVDDEDLSAAYRMILWLVLTFIHSNTVVSKICQICCPTSGKNGSWKQPPCCTPAQKLSNSSQFLFFTHCTEVLIFNLAATIKLISPV